MNVDDNYEAPWAYANGYKTILAYDPPKWFELKDGIGIFTDMKCPVKKCRLTTKYSERQTADAVIFNDKYIPTDEPRPPKQIYALYYIESPPHTSIIPVSGDVNE